MKFGAVRKGKFGAVMAKNASHATSKIISQHCFIRRFSTKWCGCNRCCNLQHFTRSLRSHHEKAARGPAAAGEEGWYDFGNGREVEGDLVHDELMRMFEPCGPVEEIIANMGPGIAYLRFESKDAMPKALEMHNVCRACRVPVLANLLQAYRKA